MAIEEEFLWTSFYEAIADKLLLYRDKRKELIECIHSIASRVEGFSSPKDRRKDDTKFSLEDICPFTAMGFFNRGNTKFDKVNITRKNVATELAAFLGVEEVVPNSFEGIPVLHNTNSWFFGCSYEREEDDIDALWEIFAQAITFSGSDNADARANFISAYDNAVKRHNVKWNLTIGLYWIRPWNFLTLDNWSHGYIEQRLVTTTGRKIKIGRNGPKESCNADDYLKVLETLKKGFKEGGYIEKEPGGYLTEDDLFPKKVDSFPSLSLISEGRCLGR